MKETAVQLLNNLKKKYNNNNQVYSENHTLVKYMNVYII